jgi:outer membrane protein assembly factor BamB
MRYALALLFSLGLTSPLHAADNWPQWRGPNAAGIADDGDYPVNFSGTEGVAWKVDVPGVGSSSPVVWGDSIFLTTSDGGQGDKADAKADSAPTHDMVLCYGFDGKERWKKTLGPGDAGKHKMGSGANPSPVTDGKHVVTYFKSGRVACHDFDGNELWQSNLQERYGEDTLWWDLGTSPILAGGNVVIAVIQAGDSYLVALDPATGEEVWKQKRQYERPEESDQAYTTPQVANVGGREVIVTWGADHLTGHDAKTGELIWESAGFNPKEEGMWRVIASHAMNDEIAVVPFGRGKFLAGVKLDGSGDVTESGRVWEEEVEGPDVPTPIVAGDKVYTLSDAGKLSCRDLNTGKELWSGMLPKGRDKYFASPVLAGEKLFCVREDGVAFVVDVSDGFNLLTEDGNELGERVIATPVPVRDRLLIRGDDHLFCFGAGEDGPAASK